MLDLDGTLVDMVEDFEDLELPHSPNDDPDWSDNYEESENNEEISEKLKFEHISFLDVDGCPVRMKIAFRPGFNEFIEYCFNNFDVGVWSMATPNYVKSIVSLFNREPKFIFNRENCDRKKSMMYKNLDTIPYTGTIIMIDDTPKVIKKTKESIILKKIKRWKSDPQDKELFLLKEELESISTWV